jgi:hypothetical protein
MGCLARLLEVLWLLYFLSSTHAFSKTGGEEEKSGLSDSLAKTVYKGAHLNRPLVIVHYLSTAKVNDCHLEVLHSPQWPS